MSEDAYDLWADDHLEQLRLVPQAVDVIARSVSRRIEHLVAELSGGVAFASPRTGRFPSSPHAAELSAQAGLIEFSGGVRVDERELVATLRELIAVPGYRELVDAADRGDVADAVEAATSLLDSDDGLVVRVAAGALAVLHEDDDIDFDIVTFAALAAHHPMLLDMTRSAHDELGLTISGKLLAAVELSSTVGFGLGTVRTVGDGFARSLTRDGSGLGRAIVD